VVRDAFSDLLLGGRCAGCDRRGRVLCTACGALLPRSGHEVRPDPAPPGLLPVFAAGEYADPLRRLILAHKEQQAFGLAGPLGRLLGVVLGEVLAEVRLDPVPSPPAVVLVPLPSAAAATRRRGHDPVLRMTRTAARALTGQGWSAAVARLLRHNGPVADQAGLDVAARAANLSGGLAVSGRAHRDLARALEPSGRLAVSGRAHRELARAVESSGPALVLLCDDVVTTGATLAEAHRALTAVGVPATAAATLAATRRRRHRPAADRPGFG